VTVLSPTQDRNRWHSPRRAVYHLNIYPRHKADADPVQCHSVPTASSGKSIAKLWHWFPSLPFQQFQVLFNSLFKVLCIFPSRYLCTIGIPPIFSFRWSLGDCLQKSLPCQTFRLIPNSCGNSQIVITTFLRQCHAILLPQ
jgi:hypothetical protein